MKNRFWQFKAATESKPAELLLYGPISNTSWWGDEVSPKQFADDLRALGEIDELTVYINSEGGDVFAGQAIYSMLKRHKARVTTYVDGLAASIASIVALAGDTVIMPKNAMMMIHNPWAAVIGNSADLRKMADDLDAVRESMIAVYTEKTGLSRNTIIAMLDEETWMTAQEAVEKGFADKVAAEKQVAASLRDGRLSINGREIPIDIWAHFPADKFASAALEPDGADEAKAKAAQERARRRRQFEYLSLIRPTL